MKLVVIEGFIDKDTQIYHRTDEVVEYTEARAKEIEKRGFGKCIDEPKATKKKEEPKAEAKAEPKKAKKK